VPLLKIDLHVHTYYSTDGITTLNEVVHYAKKRGLDAVAITDHDTVGGALELIKQQNLLILPGVEVSTGRGHLLALNITEPIPPKLDIQETVDKVRELGGIAVVAHPVVVFKPGIGHKISSAFDIDAVEVVNAAAFPFFLSTRMSRQIALRLMLPQTAGSDAHYPQEIGNAYTEVDADLNRDDIIEAIRKGKTVPCGKPISWTQRLRRVTTNLEIKLRGG